MGRRRKPVTPQANKIIPEPDGIVKIIESWICENWKGIPTTARRATLQYLFNSDEADIERFEGKPYPQRTTDGSPRVGYFSLEYDPERDYEALSDMYPQVINSTMAGFVDPELINGNVLDCRKTLQTLGYVTKMFMFPLW